MAVISMEAREVRLQIRPGIELAGLSDVGCQRQNNEDRYAYWEPTGDQDFQNKGRLAIVADGMGGYEGGQDASRIAIETIEEVYADGPNGDPRGLLVNAFQTAHGRIREYANQHPELQGMGTTCTALALLGFNLYYAHVGDSRLYIVHKGKIHPITRDHSYVGRLVEQGIISPEEAGNHPQRNILISALGAGTDLVPESSELPLTLEKDDVLVLCTDGLWSLVDEEEIQGVAAEKSLDEACQKLIKIAKERGGPDNITVQMLRMQ